MHLMCGVTGVFRYMHSTRKTKSIPMLRLLVYSSSVEFGLQEVLSLMSRDIPPDTK